MKDYAQLAIESYARLGGSVGIKAKANINTLEDLSTYYTPGVGAVAKAAADNNAKAAQLTGKNNSVAIISDGSAVLGLGNIGPTGALPVMQGKAAIFKNFADINCYPVVLNTHSAEGIVAAVKAIAPTYGAINLEDIAAPICFEVEQRLKEELDIPVMHDDQHGTAIVVLAGLINALKITNRQAGSAKVVVSGVGAAGVAIMKLLKLYEPNIDITAVDSQGAISKTRDNLNPVKQQLLEDGIISSNSQGTLADVIAGYDVFIGVSKAGLLSANVVKTMAKDPIIFAMANPDPEILPKEALAGGAAVVATGRSDFANQINNALVFPGVFRGALDNNVSNITDAHKLAAAKVIANLVAKPTATKIIPDIFDKRLVPEIAKVIV